MPDIGKQIRMIFVLPFQVTVVMPCILLWTFDFCIASVRDWRLYLGIVLLLCGLTLVSLTVRLFATIGNGTIAPWAPTQKLVITGPYAYVRNPMLSGVFMILAGEALIFCSYAVFCWFILFVIINLFYFPLSEEPGLRKRFGAEYDEYASNVPRYVPRLTPWKRK